MNSIVGVRFRKPGKVYFFDPDNLDIEKGQKTEIDTLNGCIISLARRNGIDVPGHRMIYKLIKSIEEKMLTSK